MGSICCHNKEAVGVNLVNTTAVDGDATVLGGIGEIRPSREPVSRQISSDGLKEKVGAKYKEEGVACLAWMLSTATDGGMETEAVATCEQLQELHVHLESCVDLVDGEVLVSEVAFGVVRRRRGGGDRALTNADAILRFGQLLCRWGSTNDVGLRVGAHIGTLERIEVADLINRRSSPDQPVATRASWFGSACALAINLATVSKNECMVHISSQLRDDLRTYRLVPLTISETQSSFYLAPSTAMWKDSLEASAMAEDDFDWSMPIQNLSTMFDDADVALGEGE